MKIILKIPNEQLNERRWVAEIVMNRICEEYEIILHHLNEWHLYFPVIDRLIIFQDCFFSNYEAIHSSLIDDNYNALNICMHTAEFRLNDELISLPIIFGTPNHEISEGQNVRVDIDLFGTVFVYLSRLEEYFNIKKDIHGRVHSKELFSSRNDIYHRPVVDEYIDFLKSLIRRFDASFPFKKSEYKFLLSHDVDRPYRYIKNNSFHNLKLLAGDIVHLRGFESVVYGILAALKLNSFFNVTDPYNKFNWIMAQSAARNLVSNFYFISGNSFKLYDPTYNIQDDEIKNLIKEIISHGHHVGLHPSYNCYESEMQLRKELYSLESVLNELGLGTKVIESRMHYLRWRFPVTPNVIANAGISIDHSMGFSDAVGFRCGTCHEYQAFDIKQRQKIDLRISPLIAMDCAITLDEDSGGFDEAFSKVENLILSCKKHQGTFSLLWHNSELYSENLRNLYIKILDAAS